MYSKATIVILVIGLITAFNALFIVNQTEQAIVLQFGKPVEFQDGDQKVRFISKPGLKIKIPFIQDVAKFDNRMLNFEATDKEVLDSEKKNISVSAFAKYKIIDPLIFYRTVTNEIGINRRLDQIFEAVMRDEIGKAPLSKLLTEERRSIMSRIKETVKDRAKDFGILVSDVRIVRADLPEKNSNAIYNRMIAERGKEAKEYRAQGEEEAKIIQSKADKEKKILLAEANKKSEIIRGEGDAEAIKIFSKSFGQDPEFYAFYRSMEAYRSSLSKSDTRMVISPDSEFMKYFGEINPRKSKR